MHKILSHQFVSDELSIWVDANVALRVPAQSLVDEYLRDVDLAVFQHRTRACTYEEAERCRSLGLDYPDVLDRQIQHYSELRLSRGIGLPETTVVIRRKSKKVEHFNNAWWSEVCRNSLRDQVSFMFAAGKVGLKFKFILPTKYLNPYFSITNRPAGTEEKTIEKIKF